MYDDFGSGKDTLVAMIKTLNVVTHRVEIIHRAALDDKASGDISPDFSFYMAASPDEKKIEFGGDFLADKAEVNKEIGASTVPINALVYDRDAKQFEAIPYFPPCCETVFSPDSQSLGWVDDGNVYIYSLTQKSRTQLTHFPSRAEEWKAQVQTYFPAAFQFIGWSADQSEVFFTCGQSTIRTGTMFTLCETNLQGGQIKKISREGSSFSNIASNAGYAFSPNRDCIYLQLSWLPEKICWAMGLDTNIVIDMPNNVKYRPRALESPKVSPSGKRVLFEFRPAPWNPNPTSVWMMNDDGKNAHQIVSDAKMPEWKY